MMNTSQKQIYIVIAAIALFIFAVIAFSKVCYNSSLKYRQGSPAVRSEPISAELSATPSIEDVRGRPSLELGMPKEKPASLSQVYSKYPKEDTGGDIIAYWAKIRPEEKARVYEQMDKQIAEAKESLKINPTDKKAKQILFISETLKKLCKSNFDYNLLESVPQDQGGFKPRSKQ